MKPFIVATLSILGASLLSTAAHSASFDCKKAATWVETSICKSPELSKLDEAMAKKYTNNLANAANIGGSNTYKNQLISAQRQWLTFQRNTCQTTACLSREYQEYIEEDADYGAAWDHAGELGAADYGAAWDHASELGAADLPSKNAFGEFSKIAQISLYNPATERWDNPEKVTNTVSIHSVANKPYLAIIEGVLLFTNAHMCDIGESKALWSQNHWVITDAEQEVNTELRLYPVTSRGTTQLLLKDPDYQFRRQHCGMRGYFDGMVLTR